MAARRPDEQTLHTGTHLHAPVPLKRPHHLPAPPRQPKVNLREGDTSRWKQANRAHSKQKRRRAVFVPGQDSSCGCEEAPTDAATRPQSMSTAFPHRSSCSVQVHIQPAAVEHSSVSWVPGALDACGCCLHLSGCPRESTTDVGTPRCCNVTWWQTCRKTWQSAIWPGPLSRPPPVHIKGMM